MTKFLDRLEANLTNTLTPKFFYVLIYLIVVLYMLPWFYFAFQAVNLFTFYVKGIVITALISLVDIWRWHKSFNSVSWGQLYAFWLLWPGVVIGFIYVQCRDYLEIIKE